ncbi:MAG TPA: DegT/DnrJ/EryC1/StrS family aminotransferase [Nitrospira sp.]|nr:DegT/DnrJ/EryC1/StrS family aminotransferase [Nitrospira sp.]
MIPQTSPGANYRAHQAEIDAAVARVMQSGAYILGKEVSAFEKEFSSYLGARYGIGVGSGTDALHIALRACGIGTGDRVATTPLTASATAAAIEMAGAIPVFVDVDPRTGLLDPDRLELAIRTAGSQRLKAVVPVHLYGYPVDMEAITALANRYGLMVIEDCAQSHGASIDLRKTGTWGNMAAFSFYPTKNLGAIGDGGAVITNDRSLAEKALLLREYGWRERYVSERAGFNSRLDEMQAAILRVKLPYLDHENRRRREVAELYAHALSGSILETIQPHVKVQHVYHQYVVMSDRRHELLAFLREEGIGALIHYPVPLHRQPAYATPRLPQMDTLVNSERLCERVLSLPMFPELTNEQVDKIIRVVKQWEMTVGAPV